MKLAWRPFILGLSMALPAPSTGLADAHEDMARQAIEQLPCGAGTVGARLEEETRIHSRRDLGWRSFQEGDNLDLERAFRVSKSMEIRFRWRVDHAGHAEALTDPARNLCTPP